MVHQRGQIRHHRDILRIILAYALFSSLWIGFSDEAVAILFTDPAKMTTASIAKGWIFVAVTSFLLYLLLRRQFAVVERLNADLNATLDTIPDLIFEVDENCVYRDVWVDNPRWLGRGVVQYGQNVCHFLLNDAVEAVHAALDEAVLHGRSTTRVISVDSADGLLWYELSVAKKAAFSGPGLRFVMFLHDISARMQSELALRESEARFHDLFSKNTSVMLLIEPESGAIVDANATAVAYYGYSRERLIGMSINAINTLPPERVAEERARAQRGECTTFYFSHRLSSGSVRDVEVHLTPIENGGRVLLFSIVNDITARKRAEETLSKLSLAVEQSPESIVITDLDGKIEYVNEAFVRKTGYPRAEVIGQNPRILNSGKTPPETFAAMWAALTAGQEWRGEFHNRRKDGSEYLESAIIAPLRSPEGKLTHYIGVKEDITGRRRQYDEAGGDA